MNKTLNINLGNMPFIIDDNAYKKLNTYLSQLKRIIGNDETMNDIETRLAELFNSNLQQANRNIVTLQDVEQGISIMGQPEEFNTYENNQQQTKQTYRVQKKLMRDGNDKVLGGVVSGVMKYFGFENVTIGRIILFLLPFLDVFGTLGISTTLVILTYIALWIILPKAVTPAEQMQMRGEPIQVSDIEQKLKQEFEQVEQKF